MLNIANFSKPCEDILFYEGENHYSIMKDDCGYTLLVERLVYEGEDTIVETDSYGCGSISVAIASIEALENGEEI